MGFAATRMNAHHGLQMVTVNDDVPKRIMNADKSFRGTRILWFGKSNNHRAT